MASTRLFPAILLALGSFACTPAEPANQPDMETPDTPSVDETMELTETPEPALAQPGLQVVVSLEDTGGEIIRSSTYVDVQQVTENSPPYYRLVGSDASAGTAGGTGGARVLLGEEFEQGASGKTVRATVTARAPVDGGVWIAYSTADKGNSGWQAYPLTTEFTDLVFEYDVPELVNGNNDYFALMGDPELGTDEVHVSSIVLEIIE